MKNKLWTRDFTIITVGTVVSMMGSHLSHFAMSLLVLDYTKSTLLFAIYNILYMLPNVVVPILCGPFLDRFSRKKTIYTLDFICAAIYIALVVIFQTIGFNFAILAGSCLLIGIIGSIYVVAYDSFYPLLISEGNYSKAYSVSSTLETAAMVMIPLSAFIYNKVGIVVLFAVDAASYLIAAVMEMCIKADEKYIAAQQEKRTEKKMLRQMTADFREGLDYLWQEKGLLVIAVYFCFSSVTGGVTETLNLPYFKQTFTNGEYQFMLVCGMAVVGRLAGGGIHYRHRIPKEKKYSIALLVYVLISILEGTYLFLPDTRLMMVFCFLTGILGMTSYNIRISATQRYVPDEKKGRFNGAFNTIITLGMVAGQLMAGVLGEVLPYRGIIFVVEMVNMLVAFLIVGGNRAAVAPVYNTED